MENPTPRLITDNQRSLSRGHAVNDAGDLLKVMQQLSADGPQGVSWVHLLGGRLGIQSQRLA